MVISNKLLFLYMYYAILYAYREWIEYEKNNWIYNYCYINNINYNIK